MIHPAMACNPCKHGICEYEGDCETCIAQDRVRELEAELAKLDTYLKEHDKKCNLLRVQGLPALMARAEKAEARAEKAEAFVKEWNEHPLRTRKDEEKYWYTRFKEQQARVAELEARWQAMLYWSGGLGDDDLQDIEELRKAGKTYDDYLKVEAREREAE